MEEEKAAAYYDELTRKGSGAARFKQGLGFSSSSNDTVPSKGSALPCSTSFLTTFVKASSTPSHSDKQSQLQSIQNKLNSKSNQNHPTRTRSPSPSPSRDRGIRRNPKPRSRSRSRDRDIRRNSKLRSPSRSRSRRRDRDRHENSKRGSRSRSRDRDRSRNLKRGSPSRSRSRDNYSRRRSRSRERNSRCRSRSRERSSRRRSRSRSRNDVSPRARRGEKSVKNERKRGVDYSRLIQGYDRMAPAERVKAKMKLQLTETAKNDPTRSTGSGWERFDFDKDATLDDEEIEAAEDDSSLVKHIGQSFRFSAVEARKEDQIKAAHDEAMFGGPSLPLTSEIDEEKEDSQKCTNDSAPDTSLISNQVISMQQVSWRDRVKKM